MRSLLAILTLSLCWNAIAQEGSDFLRKWLSQQCQDCEEFSSPANQQLEQNFFGGMVAGGDGGHKPMFSTLYDPKLTLEERNQIPMFKNSPKIVFNFLGETFEGHVLKASSTEIKLVGLRKVDKKNPNKIVPIIVDPNESLGFGNRLVDHICMSMGPDFISQGHSYMPTADAKYTKKDNVEVPDKYQLSDLLCQQEQKGFWGSLYQKAKTALGINDSDRAAKEVSKPSQSQSEKAGAQDQ